MPVNARNVHLFEGADEEDELVYAATVIQSEVLDRGLRYRDVALLLGDPKGSRVALEKVFGEYGIPYYADVKRTLAAHPLARFVLGWFALLSEGFDPADADAFVGSEFFGGDRRSRELYRNYLLHYANYRGGARRPVKEGADDPLVLDALRSRLLSAFDGASAAMTGGQYCRLVRGLLEKFECGKVQDELAAALEGQGLRAESAYMSRGLESILRVLSEAEELSGGTKMRAEEFSAVLSEALTALEVSLIPQYLDAVFVGDVAESRICGEQRRSSPPASPTPCPPAARTPRSSRQGHRPPAHLEGGAFPQDTRGQRPRAGKRGRRALLLFREAVPLLSALPSGEGVPPRGVQSPRCAPCPALPRSRSRRLRAPRSREGTPRHICATSPARRALPCPPCANF